METIDKERLKGAFAAMRDAMVSRKDELIALDSVMGDGDLGLTMSAVFTAAADYVASAPEDDLGAVCMKAGMAMSKAAPSTMGTLMATGFMRGGKAVKDRKSLAAADWADFFIAFRDGIMERGKSKPGEKTIVDALHPAAEALRAKAAAGASLADSFTAAFVAANEGLEATKTMVAQHGRAAYYQEKSRDKQDPGATVGMLIFKSLSDYVKVG